MAVQNKKGRRERQKSKAEKERLLQQLSWRKDEKGRLNKATQESFGPI